MERCNFLCFFMFKTFSKNVKLKFEVGINIPINFNKIEGKISCFKIIKMSNIKGNLVIIPLHIKGFTKKMLTCPH